MKNFIRIVITYYDSKPVYMKKFYEDNDGEVQSYDFKSYKAAMRELHRMARRLGKAVLLNINQFDRDICSKEVWGFMHMGE